MSRACHVLLGLIGLAVGLSLCAEKTFAAPHTIKLPIAPPQGSPEEVAQGHLRRARTYAKASFELEKKGDWHAVDGYYTACEEAWNAVWTAPDSNEILCQASQLYTEALAGLLLSADSNGRLSGQGLWVGPRWKPVCVPIQTRGMAVEAAEILRVIATPLPGDKRISRCHVRGGFGLPVAVRVAPGPEGSVSQEFAPPRQSIAATAVLRFKMPGGENVIEKFSGPLSRDHAAAILDLANPIEIAAVHIGSARPLLAADLTAPLLDMLAGMPKAGVTGFLQPFGGSDTLPRLEFLEPYQPGKIPVVFNQGLATAWAACTQSCRWLNRAMPFGNRSPASRLIKRSFRLSRGKCLPIAFFLSHSRLLSEWFLLPRRTEARPLPRWASVGPLRCWFSNRQSRCFCTTQLWQPIRMRLDCSIKKTYQRQSIF